MARTYQDYVEKMQQIADLRNVAAALHWAEETYLPERDAESRNRQLATLSTSER